MRGPRGASELRTTQVIACALIAGVTAFGVIVIFVQLESESREPTLVTYLLGAIAVPPFLASWIVPGVVSSRRLREIAARNAPPGDLETQRAIHAVYRAVTIISGALREGPALLLLVAYLLEGHWLSLLGAAVVLGCMVLAFPTGLRFQSFLEAHLRGHG